MADGAKTVDAVEGAGVEPAEEGLDESPFVDSPEELADSDETFADVMANTEDGFEDEDYEDEGDSLFDIDAGEVDPFEGMDDDEIERMLMESGAGAGATPVDMGGSFNFTDVPPGFKSGFVALVGRPNAGKSTLLNACYGEKVAITSPVAQTTRRRLRAVVNRDMCQLVVVDTPGIHKPKDSLGSELNKSALSELADVDVVAFLIDSTAPVGTGDEWVAERVAKASAPKILVLTKADIASAEQVQAQLEAARALVDFDDEIVVSSTEGFNVEAFIDLVASYLPEGPKWFPDGMGVDETDEAMAAEFIREKVLLLTREEVPHAVGVLCDSIERTKKVTRVHATIYVEREGQKGIIIGKGGSMLKRIGTEARRDLERLFGSKVYLELEVKVKRAWREDEAQIRRFGYSADE